jgi:hypothetical protein
MVSVCCSSTADTNSYQHLEPCINLHKISTLKENSGLGNLSFHAFMNYQSELRTEWKKSLLNTYFGLPYYSYMKSIKQEFTLSRFHHKNGQTYANYNQLQVYTCEIGIYKYIPSSQAPSGANENKMKYYMWKIFPFNNIRNLSGRFF